MKIFFTMVNLLNNYRVEIIQIFRNTQKCIGYEKIKKNIL